MLKIENSITTLLLILLLSIHSPIIASKMVFSAIPSENYTYTFEVKKTPDTYQYKDQEIKPMPIHTGISVEYTSRGIDNDQNICAIPEIHKINAEPLLQGKFSEKQQKECFKSLDSFSNKKFVREQDIVHPETMRERELRKKVFDSDIVLRNIYSPDNISRVLKHPLVQARFERLTKYFKYKRAKAWRESKIRKYNCILPIIDALKSGRVEQLMNDIHYADYDTANKAFQELKALFSVDGTYICDNAYPVNLLGVDILRIAADGFTTRGDFIVNHMGKECLDEIQQFSRLCNVLQKKNDIAALENLYKRLAIKVSLNEMPNMADEICFAIAERAFKDPINLTFGKIRHGSWNEACAALSDLEAQVEPMIEQPPRIIPEQEYLRESVMYNSRIDRTAVAQKFHKARPDYRPLPNSKSTVSNEHIAITESRSLPEVHEELVDLNPQIEQKIEENNCEECIEQQKCLEKTFEKEFFIPIDVQNITADILTRSDSCHAVANGFEIIARQVLGNASLCNLQHVADMQVSIDQSLDIIRAPKNDVEFVFHVATVDHVLTDLQTQSEVVAEGGPTLWERTPGLLARAVTMFVLRVNPVEQAKDWGSLALMGVNLLEQGVLAVGDAALHPITTAEKIYYATEKVCEFVINTACFTSDAVSDIYHLAPEERLQRMNDYWQKAEVFYKTIEPHLTAENIVDVTATITADIVAGKGFCSVYRYTKDLHVLSKVNQHATKMVKSFKRAIDTHLTDNPVVVTAEGIVFKMSSGMKNFDKVPREIINSTKTLLESVYAPIALKLKEEIDLIRQTIKLPFGFAEFSHKQIKIAYEHILGLEIYLTKKGKIALSGFHHDYQNAIEKSRVIDFTKKIIDENGCYKVDLIVDGSRIPGKTFFPANWSREKVVNKIYEAYDYFIKNGAIIERENGGKYLISGLTSEGIKIEMYITKAGEITTAYPKLK